MFFLRLSASLQVPFARVTDTLLGRSRIAQTAHTVCSRTLDVLFRFSILRHDKGSKQTHFLLLQRVEEWHSVICAITSSKENVTVAAEIFVGHTKQVLETEILQIGSSSPRRPIL